MGLEKKHKALLENLYKLFIFYVPESIVPEEKKESIEAKNLEPFLNAIIFVDGKGLDRGLDQNPNLLELFGKNSRLDENMFLLLDEKERLTSAQFNFLIKKYSEQMNVFVYVSNWLNENLELYIAMVDDKIRAYFALQKMAFQNHKALLHQNFILNAIPQPKPQKVIDQIETTLKALDQFKTIKEKKQPTSKLPTKKLKKESILITKEQAEDFLLRTVFNVNTETPDKSHND